MSDTPRTDAVREANIGHPLRMARMLGHARKLERELNQWKSCAELLHRSLLVGTPEEDRLAIAFFDKLKGVKP